ncbi:MAG: hypothetical protein ACOCUT_01450 [bacterium]
MEKEYDHKELAGFLKFVDESYVFHSNAGSNRDIYENIHNRILKTIQ